MTGLLAATRSVLNLATTLDIVNHLLTFSTSTLGCYFDGHREIEVVEENVPKTLNCCTVIS